MPSQSELHGAYGVQPGPLWSERWKSVLIALVAAGLFRLMANPVLIIVLAALLGMLLNGRQPTAQKASHGGRMEHTTIPLLIFLSTSAAAFTLLFSFRKELFNLAVLMSKIDLIAFGGGFASVPLMFHEIVEVRSWMDAPTFLNGIVLGQFTPGPIVITATFVGYLMAGFSGALIATVAIFLPSFLILIGIAPWFHRGADDRVQGAGRARILSPTWRKEVIHLSRPSVLSSKVRRWFISKKQLN